MAYVRRGTKIHLALTTAVGCKERCSSPTLHMSFVSGMCVLVFVHTRECASDVRSCVRVRACMRACVGNNSQRERYTSFKRVGYECRKQCC